MKFKTSAPLGSELRPHHAQVVFGQCGGTAHQFTMRVPEGGRVRRGFRQFRRPACQFVVFQRPVPEHITQPRTEAVAQLEDFHIGSAAARAGIAAVLHQCQFRIRWSEHMIVDRIHRAIESA